MAELYRNKKLRLYAEKRIFERYTEPGNPTLHYVLDIFLAVGVQSEIAEQILIPLGFAETRGLSKRCFESKRCRLELFETCPEYKTILWLESKQHHRRNLRREVKNILEVYSRIIDLTNVPDEMEYSRDVSEKIEQTLATISDIPTERSYPEMGFGIMNRKLMEKLQILSGDTRSIFK